MATETKLPGSALRTLRALGHALSPVVAMGKEGLSDALVRAVDDAIATHELVKVKIQRESPVDRHEAAIELAARTGSVLAQVVGRTVLLYRRHPKKPKISLSGKPSAPARKEAGAAPLREGGGQRGRGRGREQRRGRGRPVEKPVRAGDDPGDND